MSNDLVTFIVRCEKSKYELKVNTPATITEFIEKLKTELEVHNDNEIVILCPTSDGKMVEINSDDDIEVLKKTKLCYNAVSKEIYCNVELVVIIIYPQLPDNPNAQIKILSNTISELSSKFVELSLSMENNMKSIKTDIFEHLQKKSDSPQKNVSLGDQNSCGSSLEPKNVQRNKKNKNGKEKLSTTVSSNVTSNNNLSNLSESLNQPKKTEVKDIDTLLEMLAKDGFTNTIQNIIVLKRFENDYSKAVNYLKSTNSNST